MPTNNFDKYINDYYNIIKQVDHSTLKKIINKLKIFNRKNSGKIWIFGNGGSHATSSHIATDFTKNTNIKMLTISDADQITCLVMIMVMKIGFQLLLKVLNK